MNKRTNNKPGKGKSPRQRAANGGNTQAEIDGVFVSPLGAGDVPALLEFIELLRSPDFKLPLREWLGIFGPQEAVGWEGLHDRLEDWTSLWEFKEFKDFKGGELWAAEPKRTLREHLECSVFAFLQDRPEVAERLDEPMGYWEAQKCIADESLRWFMQEVHKADNGA